MVVKVGIIGMGFMGRMHLASYAKLRNAKVVAFADIDEKVRTGKGAGAGNIGDTGFAFDPENFESVYDSAKKLVADPDIDLVDICVPTPSHKKVFVQAIASGKHVIVEKPIARRPSDVAEMLKAAKKTKANVMVAQCIRFWPAYAKLKQYIDSGKLGKCKSVLLRRHGGRNLWSDWYKKAALSGGALYDLHVHDTDFVNYLFGKPTSVYSAASKGGTTDYGVDHVVTNYAYPKSKVEAVTAIGAWHQHGTWPFVMAYTAVFEKATLDFDINRSEPAPLMLYTDKTAKPIKIAPTDGWFEEIKYFVGCCVKGVKPELNLTSSTAVTMKIVQAEEESTKTGKVVKLNRHSPV